MSVPCFLNVSYSALCMNSVRSLGDGLVGRDCRVRERLARRLSTGFGMITFLFGGRTLVSGKKIWLCFALVVVQARFGTAQKEIR